MDRYTFFVTTRTVYWEDIWGQPVQTRVLPKLQPVTLEIQHCALKDEATFPNVKFVLAKMWEHFFFASR